MDPEALGIPTRGSLVKTEAYQVLADFEENYWWFRSRRELVVGQVARALEGRDPESTRILDFGCGTGYTLKSFAPFGAVTGADNHDESLSEFRKSSFPMLDLRKDVSAELGRFDLVTALDVLEHFESEAEGLAKISCFAKPGGKILLTVPAYPWLWSGEDVVSRHFRRYTRGGLVEACERAGLRVEFASYFNLSILPLQTAAIYAERLLGRNPEATNVRPLPRVLNEILYRITSFENRRVGAQRLRLPAGGSIVARLRRP